MLPRRGIPDEAVRTGTFKAVTRRRLHRLTGFHHLCVLVYVIDTSQIHLPGTCKADVSHDGFTTAHKCKCIC